MTNVHARTELAAPVLLAAIGIAAAIGGIGYGLTDDEGRVGTGFLPLAAGGMLAVLAVAEVINTRRRQVATAHGEHHGSVAEAIADVPDGATQAHDPDVDIVGRTPAQRVRILAAVLGVIVLAVVLVPVLGFLLSFGALLLTITGVVERMGVLKSAVVTVATIAVLWLVFAQFLSIPLPQGMLGLI
jgi:putative tricarboxylic transport membrane protein